MGWITVKQKGLNQEQIDEICERLWSEEQSRANRNCHDCGAKPGEQHDQNCDVARCTSCGFHRLSCNCEDGETDVWTGLWPGVKECYDLKLISFFDSPDSTRGWCFDLNRYAIIKNNKIL